MKKLTSRLVSAAAGSLLAGLVMSVAYASSTSPAAVPPDLTDGASLDRLAGEGLLIDVAMAGKRLVAVGAFGHILLSDDNGANWRQTTSVPSRVTLTSVSFADEKTGFAVGHDTTILKTVDGGETWTQVYGGDDSENVLLSVVAADAQTVFAVGTFNLVLESKDGGQTWSERQLVTEETAVAALLSCKEPKPQDAEEGDLKTEEDIPPTDLHLQSAFMGPDGSIFIAAEKGSIYRSLDRGATWDMKVTCYAGSFWGGAALRDGSIVVAGMRGNVWVSRDLGANWAQVESNSPESLSGVTQLSDGTIMIVGLGGAVVYSTDNGASFKAYNRPDRKGLAAVEQGPDGKVVIVGEPGIVFELAKPAS